MHGKFNYPFPKHNLFVGILINVENGPVETLLSDLKHTMKHHFTKEKFSVISYIDGNNTFFFFLLKSLQL